MLFSSEKFLQSSETVLSGKSMGIKEYFTIFEDLTESEIKFVDGQVGRLTRLKKYVDKKVEIISFGRYYRGILRYCGKSDYYEIENEAKFHNAYKCRGTHITHIRFI
mgnify:CR=1 FL=1